jgi:hypothetical protein
LLNPQRNAAREELVREYATARELSLEHRAANRTGTQASAGAPQKVNHELQMVRTRSLTELLNLRKVIVFT